MNKTSFFLIGMAILMSGCALHNGLTTNAKAGAEMLTRANEEDRGSFGMYAFKTTTDEFSVNSNTDQP